MGCSWHAEEPISGDVQLDGGGKEVLNQRMVVKENLPIIYHHDYVSELPPNHRFAMKKFHGVMACLRAENLILENQVHSPMELSKETALLVHTEEYVNKFYSGNTSADEQRETGFKWSPGLLRRCRLEAGGSVLGTKMAIKCGLACNAGGGTHHAFPDHGAGFCLLNDLAIAAQLALHRNLISRVLIVDLDVHQGDGTALTFKDNDHVFTFSMHGEKNYPFRKKESNLDIGLPNNTNDAEYMAHLCDHLPTVLDSFRPDIVLFNAGVDPHEDDDLGKLSLTDQGLFERDYYVICEAVSRGIPCFTVIGGGYSKDILKLSKRHTIVIRAALKVWDEKL